MGSPIITVEGLGKKYRLKHQERQRYTALRDVIADKVKQIFRANRRAVEPNRFSEEFWALKDVSFEIKQGEVVGIIGRNGAGKSTLLKILSRITEPTTGRVRIRGRVASLLEVGTGFHPELTGRENIYLNGAILGMSRAEIRQKFDEIVAFAEVEKFLDTPVKRFSSGMYVRLAFAVAAHLEPEILLVDEVLAVGDAQFQKKCLGKMSNMSRGGRTVLFVSHNMAVIQALCPKSVLLDCGRVKYIGRSGDTAAVYLRSCDRTHRLHRPARADGAPTVTRLELVDLQCHRHTAICLEIEIQGQIRKRCSVEVKLFDASGVPIGIGSIGLLNPSESLELCGGIEELRCKLHLPRMAKGEYFVSVQLAVPMIEIIDSTGDGLRVELDPTLLSGYERVLDASWGHGPIEIPCEILQTTAAGFSKAPVPRVQEIQGSASFRT